MSELAVAGCLQRSSASRPAEAGTAGLTGTRVPVRIQARWLGAKRGASNPSLISRVTAKRLNAGGVRNKRVLSWKPSDAVSMSPSTAEMMRSEERRVGNEGGERRERTR